MIDLRELMSVDLAMGHLSERFDIRILFLIFLDTILKLFNELYTPVLCVWNATLDHGALAAARPSDEHGDQDQN